MILELRNICKTYMQGKLDVPVLKNVSLSVEEGEYLAIMGPSGSGKTTLMNLIGCLDTPTSGEYLLEGQDLSGETDLKLSQVRLRSIGFVFQSFYLLSRQSAVENVALPLLYAGVRRKERLDLARKALERVGLGDRTDFKPTQLSGGQCQRVAIARAIVNNPKILLADEPTGALDTKAGEQIMEIFQRLNDEGVTIVMITHEPQIAAHAQRTLHIRDGRLTDADGNFLSPAEPEPAEETEPQEQLPAREQLSLPLSSREASVKEVVAETSPAPAKQAEDFQAESSSELPENPIAAPSPHEEAPASPPEAPAPAAEKPALPVVPEGTAASEATAEQPAKQQDEEETEAFNDTDTDTFLDTEIAALLDAEVSFATGDDFLQKAGILPAPEEAPQEPEAVTQPEPESPALVARSTKTGAPDQISFDIWAQPEPPAGEAESFSKLEPAEQLDFSALEKEEAAEAAPSSEAFEPAEAEQELPFDTAFDAVESYTPHEPEPTGGQFGIPLKTDVDLSNLWGQQETGTAASESKAPEEAAPAKESAPRKLIEIEDIRVDFGDDEP